MEEHEKRIRDEIIYVGKRLYSYGLVAATSGNISAKLDDKNILITGSGVALCNLEHGDIIKVNLANNEVVGVKKASSELPLHSLIYKNFPCHKVIHCHPPLINGYFAVSSCLKALTFETKCYLGEVPVVKQDTPSVTEPQAVIDALGRNNLVVLKNHGVVSVSDKFDNALGLIESLEEAVRSAALARLFDKDILDDLDDLDKPLKKTLSKTNIAYTMFSHEHMQAIVALVNKDEFIAQKGKELDLTVKLAIKLDDADKVYKFSFDKGKIISLNTDSEAPFVISASSLVWEEVFLGKLDSFVAVTQGRMKLEGQMGQLSRWYVPFTRLFELFKQVKIAESKN